MQFAEISHLGRPIVFFEIDIDCVIRSPGRVGLFIP